MSASFGATPWYIDAGNVSLAHRPRLYWTEWELVAEEDATLDFFPSGRARITLKAHVEPAKYLHEGWSMVDQGLLPTFTTSRPRSAPGYKPAGLRQCCPDDVKRWTQDSFRFPPYQYQARHCLSNKHGAMRIPDVEEREVIMGFPKGYTAQCMPKSKHGSQAYQDCRLTLVGNSWNVTIIAWLLSRLGARLGLNPNLRVQDLVERTAPGSETDFQTYLQRPMMGSCRRVGHLANELKLVRKLCTLISIKGDDLLIQPSTDDQVKYQRLRASIPSKLWKWRTICGWTWSQQAEHINVLELRAVLTALRWRIERKGITHSKFVHLVDSLVCLHALSRGRSSSRKLKRTLLRINSLLLATNSHVLWAYVNTKDNPANAPSRRPRKRKWSNA